MSDCQSHEATLEAYVAGERDESVIGPLIQHSLRCQDCRRLLELHRDLCNLSSANPVPGPVEFDALRERVLSKIAVGKRRGGAWIRVVGAVAASILLFVVGLLAGRSLAGGALPNRLAQAVSAEAAANRDLADVENSRFTYSDVSFRRLEGEQVALDFNLTTHLQLVEPAHSELVREVLVHSLLHPSSTGSRLKAISLAASHPGPKVTEALIFALRRDPNLAVRLQALTILSDQMHEPQVQLALLHALRQDESVQVRLVALECLAAESVAPDRIRRAIQENERPGDDALRVRLAEYETRL